MKRSINKFISNGNLSLMAIIAMTVLSMMVFSCSSQKKVVADQTPIEEEMPEAPEKTTNERGCEMYGGNKERALTAYSLYREDFKNGYYDKAMENWEYIFENAPGLREQTFKDGDVMFKKMIDEETDPAKKKALFDKLMDIYDQRAICWGESAFLSGKKAFAYYKYYPEEEDLIFDFAEKAVINGGNETPASQVQMYWRYLIKRLKAQKINKDELTEAYELIKGIIDHNLENGDEKDKKSYQDVLDEIQPAYESIIDVYAGAAAVKCEINNCQEVKDCVEPRYRENTEDLNNVKLLFAYMLKFKCYDDPLFFEVTQKYSTLEPKASTLKILGNIYRKRKDLPMALDYYQQSFDLETDNAKKAKLKMSMAGIVAYELPGKDFAKAREHALEAAKLNPSSGEPYILIGRMYAASGKLCGPGTGFKSQRVLWPAFDMWNKAKQIDPSSADKAQQYINNYYQYLPERKDLFLKDIEVGSMYPFNDCWIGGSYRARVK